MSDIEINYINHNGTKGNQTIHRTMMKFGDYDEEISKNTLIPFIIGEKITRNVKDGDKMVYQEFIIDRIETHLSKSEDGQSIYLERQVFVIKKLEESI